jgi:hypothetical protein
MKYFEKHSIFVSATKKKLAKTNKFVSTINEEEFEDLALNFKTDLERFALLINQELDKEPSDLWLFGAHIFTQFILSTNLRKQRITGILDNAKHKKGKRLYGSPFEIFNPAEVKFQKSIIVLAAGQYEEEIIETLIPLLPKGSKIISKNKGIIFI